MAAITDQMNKSALLSMFMYLDVNIDDGSTIGQAMDKINRDILAPAEQNHYDILRQAIDNDASFGNLQMTHQSKNMLDQGFNSATAAAVFKDPETGANVVAFRGTADGEWLDNAQALVQQSSPQQDEALRYFNEVASREGWTTDDHVTVTGHSKGGNKAQFITMNSDLVDECHSMDGQGFSPEAIAKMKETGHFDERAGKIIRINGENDFVSPNGIQIAKDQNTIFIQQDDQKNPLDYHQIFSKFNPDGSLREQAPQQGEMGAFATRLSAIVMRYPEDIRGPVANAVMQAVEMQEGSRISINGEAASLFDCIGLIVFGLPIVVSTLLLTPEGRALLRDLAEKLTPGIFGGITDKISALIDSTVDQIKSKAEDLMSWIRSRWPKQHPKSHGHAHRKSPMATSLPAIFTVHTGVLKANAEELQKKYNMLADASANISRLVGKLPFVIRIVSKIDSTLRSESRRLMEAATVCKKMKKALLDVAQTYERAEQNAMPK